jgi:hypothetical protein
MNGPIAQLVALACHANAVLRIRAAPSFFPVNSTCQFCDSVDFVRLKRAWLTNSFTEAPLAANPDAWFEQLKASGNRAVFVRHSPQNQPGISDRMSAAFVGGGGRWLLEARTLTGSDYYEGRWTVWDQNAPQKRIWRVTYGLIAESSPSQAASEKDLLCLKADAASALSEIETFARRQNLSRFADCFRKAIDCLDSDRPFDLVYHKDLAPDEILARESAQLLAAAQAAWVFGGMGSWNDLGFEGTDQQTYEALSERLFDLLNRVICAATNSSAAQQAGV